MSFAARFNGRRLWTGDELDLSQFQQRSARMRVDPADLVTA